MTEAALHLPTCLAAFLEAPMNPVCAERLHAAMADEGDYAWRARWDASQAALADKAWEFMHDALLAEGDQRSDYCSVLRALIETLMAGRRRAARQKAEFAKRYRGSELPAKAWWLELD